MNNTIYAPGNRLVIRDAEWLVKRARNLENNNWILDVVGLSEVVRDMESQFVTKFEKDIVHLDPVDTEFILDESSGYRDSILFMESLLRKRTPKDSKIYVGDKAAIDAVPYQMEPAAKALTQHRQRILIADAVGLGKTIECGVLLSELIKRGRGKRILVLAVKSMLTQFQKEMWTRFTIPLIRLDSTGIQRVKQHIPAGHNPFLYFDKSIISIDTLKRESEYRHYLENAWWDIIVIDEAHNVAERGTNSMRSKLAKLISSRSDTLIMLSATPHDGKKESFASLMNMLDPTAIVDPSNYGPEDIRGLFIRRFKKDVKHQVTAQFRERKIDQIVVGSSVKEEIAFDALTSLSFKGIDARKRKGSMLLKTGLEKSLFSSPAACIKTCQNRINKLKNDYVEYMDDIEQLESFVSFLENINKEDFSKYNKLVDFLNKNTWNWNKKDPGDRLVIFTERIETLKYLEENLKKDLKLKDKEVGILYGSMSDTEIQETVERFGNRTEPIRLLIASDVASEGINLHYQSHRMIHFDIPWSLMVFQQRNGRIDRYGQEKDPLIYYLLTDSENEKIKGDQRILQLLIEKDQQVHESIGDPAEFTGQYTIEDEELQVADAIESGNGVEQLNTEFSREEFDPMAEMLALLSGDEKVEEDHQGEQLSFYKRDYDFVRDSIRYMQGKHSWYAEFLDDGNTIEIENRDDFKVLKKSLPSEIIPKKEESFILTDDIEAVKKEMERCRKEESIWPKKMLLWDQNPLVSWLNDRLLTIFGRNQAPFIYIPNKSGRNEVTVLISGMIPNQKGQPVVEDWFGVVFEDTQYREIITLKEFMNKTELGVKQTPNSSKEIDSKLAKKILPVALDKARHQFRRQKAEFVTRINPQIVEQSDRLKELEERQKKFIYENVNKNRIEKELRLVTQTFEDYRQWVRSTLQSSDEPYLRVVAMVKENER